MPYKPTILPRLNPRQVAPAPPHSAAFPRGHDDGGIRPMELDGVTVPRPKLTDQEKDYRRMNGLCLYCGGPGHIALNCPRTPKPRSVNGVVVPCQPTPTPENSGKE